MINTYGYENGLLGIASDIEVLMVIIGSCGILVTDILMIKILFLTIAVIQEFSVAEVDVYLYPAFCERYIPEAFGSDVYLWNRLGINAIDKRTHGEQVVTYHHFLLPATHLQEELFPTQVGITLLQVGFVVSMQGTDGIDST